MPGCRQVAKIIPDGFVPLWQQVAHLAGNERGGQREPLTEVALLS